VGEACEPRCVSNCTGHGRCDAPDTCVCAGQWSGEHCEQAACLQPCLHGTCTAPDVCACKSHYHGPACDVYCDRHGEYIGGNLTGGLRGLPRAERASTRESQCRCHAGWAGAGCGQPVCHAVKCVRGTCVAPNECRSLSLSLSPSLSLSLSLSPPPSLSLSLSHTHRCAGACGRGWGRSATRRRRKKARCASSRTTCSVSESANGARR
jgi:hypothetical protein